jgi:hypothetical protein
MRRTAPRTVCAAAASAPPDAEAATEALTYEEAFCGADAVTARAALSSGAAALTLLRLTSRTARLATEPSEDADGVEEDSEEEEALYAVDESLAQVADALGGGDDAEAFAALLEAQWFSALHAHRHVTSPGSALALAGVAPALAGDAAAALRARCRGSAFLAALRADVAARAPDALLPFGEAAAAVAMLDDEAAALAPLPSYEARTAWLCNLEAALDLAEQIESDEASWPSAAIALCGSLAADAPLLNVLHVLLPFAGGGVVPPTRDRVAALALMPRLEGLCDHGLAVPARALAAAAAARVAKNRWRAGVRFLAADVAAATAATDDLLVVLMPCDASGGVEGADVAVRVAAQRAQGGLQLPLCVALGAPAPQPAGGAALHARREALAAAATDALQLAVRSYM